MPAKSSKQRSVGSRAFWVAIVVVILVMGSVAVPPMWNLSAILSTRSPETKALQDLKSVALACKLYAQDNKGRYPDTLSDLVPEHLPDDKWLFYVNPKTHERKPWCYKAGLMDISPAELFLVWSPEATPSGKRICVRCDASGCIISEDKFRAEMKRQTRER
jgi:hypothetical protein